MSKRMTLDARLARLTGSPEGINFKESLQAVAAHLDQQKKTYIEIAIDPKTKEIAWSFTATLQNSAN